MSAATNPIKHGTDHLISAVCLVEYFRSISMGSDSPQLQNALPELSLQLMIDILPHELGSVCEYSSFTLLDFLPFYDHDDSTLQS